MEYQKIVNLLESTSDNLSKFRTRSWVEINDNREKHIKLMTLDLRLQC